MPFVPDAAASTGTVILDKSESDIRENQYAWIYPLIDADVYSEPSSSSGRQKRAQVKTISPPPVPLPLNHQVTLTFTAPARFAEASPRQRIYFASTPVSYCFKKAPASNELEILRYADYSFSSSQPEPSDMGTGVLMAQGVANLLSDSHDLPLTLTPSSLVNNAMVHLQPRFNVNGETLQYRHQVQVINVP
jgi:MSHA biogenesis protein MshO